MKKLVSLAILFLVPALASAQQVAHTSYSQRPQPQTRPTCLRLLFGRDCQPRGSQTDPALLAALNALQNGQAQIIALLSAHPLTPTAPQIQYIPTPGASLLNPYYPPAAGSAPLAGSVNGGPGTVPISVDPIKLGPVASNGAPLLPYGGLPLQNIPLGSAPYQNIGLGGAPLQQVPLGAAPYQNVPLGSAPLQSIPLGGLPQQQIFMGGAPQTPQTPQTPQAPQASAPQAPQAPQAPSAPSAPVTPPLQQIGLGGQPYQNIPLGGLPYQQIGLGGQPYQNIGLGGAPLQQVPLGQQPLQQIPLGSVPQGQGQTVPQGQQTIPLGTNPVAPQGQGGAVPQGGGAGSIPLGAPPAGMPRVPNSNSRVPMYLQRFTTVQQAALWQPARSR